MRSMYVLTENSEHDIQYHVTKCGVGDYVIMVDGRVAAIFERKTWKDLAASIKDGRYDAQHQSMMTKKQELGCFCFYLIEGILRANVKNVANIPVKSLHRKIIKNSLCGTQFIQTKNEFVTAEILVEYAIMIRRLYDAGEVSFPEPTDDSGFEIIPETIKKNRVVGASETELNMWKSYPAVGNNTAMILQTKFDISRILSITPEDVSGLKYSTGISVPANVKSSLINNQDDPAVHMRILSSINGISENIAANILNVISLRDIINNEHTDELLNIKINGRRITKKIQRILEFFKGPDCKEGASQG